jgi:uncharacterized membrane protein YkvA (DUF1232 family)
MEQRRFAEQARGALLPKLKAHAARLKRNIVALYFAVRDPRTPWYAKVFVGCVVAYALSPIDFIPDMIPILGYLDDLILLPIGIYIAMKLIPPEILKECHAKAAALGGTLPRSWRAAALIVLLWLVAVVLVGYFSAETFLTRESAAPRT